MPLEIEDVGRAIFRALRDMDAQCPKGLCNYVSSSPFAGKKRKDEAAITWGITEALRPVWRVEQREHRYPDSTGRCDRVVELGNGSRLWLEIKLAWRTWFFDVVKDNHPFLYNGYFTGKHKKYSVAHDFQKSLRIGPNQGRYVAILIVGFDRKDAKMADDMAALAGRERLTACGWNIMADAWSTKQTDECWHRCWYCWREIPQSTDQDAVAGKFSTAEGAVRPPTPESDVTQHEAQIRDHIRAFELQSLRDPQDAVARYNTGVAYGELGMPEKAIAAYRSAIEIDARYAAAHYNLGCTLLESELPHEAKAEFEQVTKLAPTMAEGFFMLGTVCGALGFPKQLIEATKAGLQFAPDSAEACLNIGAASNRVGEFKQAVEFLTRSIILDCDNADAYLQLGKAHRGLDNVSEEILAYRTALEIREDFIDAWFHLGAAHLKRLRGSGAKVVYKESGGEFDLTDPEQIFYFALGLVAVGLKDEAKEHLPKLKETAPAFADELERHIDGENDVSVAASERVS